MKPVRALFFDLDETLLDNGGVQESIVRTCREIATRHPGLEAARLVEANGRAWQDYWPTVEDDWTLGTLDGASMRLEVWRLTLRACGCDDESIAQLALQTHIQHGREALRLFSDVPALFAALRRASVPRALITNGAADSQREKLRVLGIEDWFDAVVISGEIGIAKPDTSVFERALDQLAVEPENAWHVGDTLGTDVAGAKAAGLTAVWLNRGGRVRGEGEPEPDVEIRSLSTLRASLAE